MSGKINREETRSEFENILRETLEKNRKVDKEEIQKRLEAMINYGIGRVDYYENYRTTFQTIAMGLIGGAFAIAALLVGSNANYGLWVSCFILGSALILLVGGIWTLWSYLLESAPDYAYRDVADIKSWYFKYNMPAGTKSAPKKGSVKRESAVRQHAEGFKAYVRSWINHAADQDTLILEDLEQVYILFALQKFKRDFVIKVSWRLGWIFSLSAILLLVGLILVMTSQPDGASTLSQDPSLLSFY